MAFTSADLASIDAAIASGEMAVEINGKRVQYRSIGELQDARRLILAELASAAAGTGANGVRRGTYHPVFVTSRGF